jgi:hypothetical protein
LRSSRSCTGTLTGTTVDRFAVSAARRRRRYVSLGTIRFTLRAGIPKTVVLRLSPAGRGLLNRKHQLQVRFTITLTRAGAKSVSRRTLTLRTRRLP